MILTVVSGLISLLIRFDDVRIGLQIKNIDLFMKGKGRRTCMNDWYSNIYSKKITRTSIGFLNID